MKVVKSNTKDDKKTDSIRKQEEMQAQIMAIHMQHQEARQREKEMMMQVIMNSMAMTGT